jgi:hypothetical protein
MDNMSKLHKTLLPPFQKYCRQLGVKDNIFEMDGVAWFEGHIITLH